MIIGNIFVLNDYGEFGKFKNYSSIVLLCTKMLVAMDLSSYYFPMLF